MSCFAKVYSTVLLPFSGAMACFELIKETAAFLSNVGYTALLHRLRIVCAASKDRNQNGLNANIGCGSAIYET